MPFQQLRNLCLRVSGFSQAVNLVSFVLGQLVVAHQCFSLGRERRRLYQLASLLPIALTIRNRDPAKQAWLIVSKEPLSKKEQDQRELVWSERFDSKGLEFVVPLRPTGIKMFPRANNPKTKQYYEAVIPERFVSRSYIYIDFPSLVMDGGYYYSIDLGTYVETGQ